MSISKKISKYDKLLISKISNPNKWPSFNKPDFLYKLNKIADTSIGKNTIEGHLASVLIYHQLCEELIKLLIKCSQFSIQVSICPRRMTRKNKRVRMFGKLLEELDNNISFNNKEKFIYECRKLNKNRIKIVHKLTLKTSTDNIEAITQDIKKTYKKILIYFQSAYKEYQHSFADLRKNCDWIELL